MANRKIFSPAGPVGRGKVAPGGVRSEETPTKVLDFGRGATTPAGKQGNMVAELTRSLSLSGMGGMGGMGKGPPPTVRGRPGAGGAAPRKPSMPVQMRMVGLPRFASSTDERVIDTEEQSSFSAPLTKLHSNLDLTAQKNKRAVANARKVRRPGTRPRYAQVRTADTDRVVFEGRTPTPAPAAKGSGRKGLFGKKASSKVAPQVAAKGQQKQTKKKGPPPKVAARKPSVSKDPALQQAAAAAATAKPTAATTTTAATTATTSTAAASPPPKKSILKRTKGSQEELAIQRRLRAELEAEGKADLLRPKSFVASSDDEEAAGEERRGTLTRNYGKAISMRFVKTRTKNKLDASPSSPARTPVTPSGSIGLAIADMFREVDADAASDEEDAPAALAPIPRRSLTAEPQAGCDTIHEEAGEAEEAVRDEDRAGRDEDSPAPPAESAASSGSEEEEEEEEEAVVVVQEPTTTAPGPTAAGEAAGDAAPESEHESRTSEAKAKSPSPSPSPSPTATAVAPGEAPERQTSSPTSLPGYEAAPDAADTPVSKSPDAGWVLVNENDATPEAGTGSPAATTPADPPEGEGEGEGEGEEEEEKEEKEEKDDEDYDGFDDVVFAPARDTATKGEAASTATSTATSSKGGEEEEEEEEKEGLPAGAKMSTKNKFGTVRMGNTPVSDLRKRFAAFTQG